MDGACDRVGGPILSQLPQTHRGISCVTRSSPSSRSSFCSRWPPPAAPRPSRPCSLSVRCPTSARPWSTTSRSWRPTPVPTASGSRKTSPSPPAARPSTGHAKRPSRCSARRRCDWARGPAPTCWVTASTSSVRWSIRRA